MDDREGPDDLAAAFHTARQHDARHVALEGLHAIKHALRFGAAVGPIITTDADAVIALVSRVAPDVRQDLVRGMHAVPDAVFTRCCVKPPASPVLALARRPSDPPLPHELTNPAPIVVLESPRHAGNAGAAIRVAAAADAAGLYTTGEMDPWSPAVIRGAAGLQFALAVRRLDSISELMPSTSTRTVIAFDPDGEDLDPNTMGPAPIMLFGTERDGLSDNALALAHQRVRLPMRPGVSSLNLATSVAAALYTLRFSQ